MRRPSISQTLNCSLTAVRKRSAPSGIAVTRIRGNNRRCRSQSFQNHHVGNSPRRWGLSIRERWGRGASSRVTVSGVDDTQPVRKDKARPIVVPRIGPQQPGAATELLAVPRSTTTRRVVLLAHAPRAQHGQLEPHMPALVHRPNDAEPARLDKPQRADRRASDRRVRVLLARRRRPCPTSFDTTVGS